MAAGVRSLLAFWVGGASGGVAAPAPARPAVPGGQMPTFDRVAELVWDDEELLLWS